MSESVVFPTLLSQSEYQRMPADEKETHIKEILRQTLKLNSSGVTVTQLKQKLPFDRRIIEKHLDVMEFTNEIYTFKLGSNKLYVPNHKAMHEATKYSERLGFNEYQVYTLHNKLGDFAVIQQRDLKKDSQDIIGGLQIPLEHYEQFVKYLGRSISDMEKRGLN
jgi:hypothetical protein